MYILINSIKMLKNIYPLLFLFFFVSTEAQTWTKISTPQTDQSFTDIKLGQDGNLYLLTAQGLYKSEDNGDNWTIYHNGCRNSDKLGDELMTITKDGLVFIDKALTINQTDGNSLTRSIYYTLGAYQRSAQMVSLSTGEIIRSYRDNWGPNNVYYSISSDNGNTWDDKKSSASFALKNYKHPIFFIAENDDVYYVGADYSLYRSTDKGETYTSSGTVADWDEKLSVLDKKTGTFYVVSKATINNPWKLNKSTDHGATFTEIPLASNHPITAIYANDNHLIVTHSNYCSYSNDGGATWTDKKSMFSDIGFPEKYIFTKDGSILGLNVGMYGVAKIDFSSNTVSSSVNGIEQATTTTHYYNGSRLGASFSGRAYYSDDLGSSWTRLKGEGAICGNIFVSSDNTIYTASTKNGTWNGVYVQDENDSMVAVSADVESVWNMSGTNSMFEDENGNIYCVSNLYGLYKSSDGKNFTRQSDAPFTELSDQTLWYDKANKRMFGFISTGGDMHYSDDYGVTWTNGTKVTDQGFPNFIQFAGGSKAWTYMWTTKPENNGFYSSSDLTNWSGPSVSTGSFDSRYDQFVKGEDESQIFLASTKGYVIVSNDKGQTWTEFESGLDSFDIIDRTENTIKIVPVSHMSASGGKLILATTGSLYITDNKSSSGNVKDNSSSFLEVYPNPVNEVLFLKSDFKINNVTIVDLSGKEMLSTSEVSNFIDVSSLQSGLYIVRVSTTNGISNSKIYKK